MSKRKLLLNIPVDLLRPDEFLARIDKAISNPVTKSVFAVNPEKILRAQKDAELYRALRESDFLIPDGIGTALGIWLIYGKKIIRTTGINLMHRLLEVAAKKKYKIFIFGGSNSVNMIASENIKNQFSSIEIVGSQHGYIQEDENEILIKKINKSKAHILFVGLGSPKQEKWIYRNKNKLNAKICMGIGGSLDVMAGKIPGAPQLIRKLGMEWLYRLMIEPTRLKRQSLLPKFVLAMMKEKISHT